MLICVFCIVVCLCVHARMYMLPSRSSSGAQAAVRGRYTGDKAGATHLLAAHTDGNKKALFQELLSDRATEASPRTSDHRDAPPTPSSASAPARISASHFAGLVQSAKHDSATRSSHARLLGKHGRAAAHQRSEGAPARSCRRVRKCQRLNYHCCTRAAESRGPLLPVDVPEVSLYPISSEFPGSALARLPGRGNEAGAAACTQEQLQH